MFSPTQEAPASGKVAFCSLLFSLFLAAALATSPAFAQIYEWKDPETGSTKLSNLRPPWYRSNQVSGPRTQLILNGQLIDDTAVQTTPEQQAAVRSRLDDTARQQANENRQQQLQLIQARQQAEIQDKQRAIQEQQQANRERIQQLLRERSNLMIKIAGGPLVAGRGPFDIASVAAAANRLAEVNRELNALDTAGAEQRTDDQRRGLGAAAQVQVNEAARSQHQLERMQEKSMEQLDKLQEKEDFKRDVKDVVKDTIRDCARGGYGC